MSTLPADGVLREEVDVEAAWLDYNGHMNVAFYLRVFDDAGDRLTALAGMGAAYTRRTHNSWVALESHITFRAEAMEGDRLRVESCVLDVERKKIHVCQAMFRGDTLLATHEQLGLHFDTVARRATPFEAAVFERLVALRDARAAQPRPPWVGRAIALGQAPPA